MQHELNGPPIPHPESIKQSISPFLTMSLCVNRPLQIRMVPTFSDWQISLTFPVFFAVFQYFLKFFFLNFSIYTIFAGFSLLLADKFVTFPVFCQFSSIIFSDFSSILGKIPWLFYSA